MKNKGNDYKTLFFLWIVGVSALFVVSLINDWSPFIKWGSLIALTIISLWIAVTIKKADDKLKYDREKAIAAKKEMAETRERKIAIEVEAIARVDAAMREEESI